MSKTQTNQKPSLRKLASNRCGGGGEPVKGRLFQDWASPFNSIYSWSDTLGYLLVLQALSCVIINFVMAHGLNILGVRVQPDLWEVGTHPIGLQKWRSFKHFFKVSRSCAFATMFAKFNLHSCLTGAACHGFDKFPYSYRTAKDSQAQLVTIACTHSNA